MLQIFRTLSSEHILTYKVHARHTKTGRVDLAEMTQGRLDSRAKMETGRVDPLPVTVKKIHFL